ncbi:MAG: tRNA-binding protein [Flavobacteriaceae bacterium]|nr:tRNA-binding protein [Flavobacteriaceae bacterium]
MNDLSWEDFMKMDLRVGTVISSRSFPEARIPAYQMEIDFGDEIGIKKTSAQITELYDHKDLIGKQIIGVVNFPKKQIGPFMSECLVLGAVADKSVTLLVPDHPVKNGLRIS